MVTETANLVFAAETSGLTEADRKLQQLNKTGAQTETRVERLGKAWDRNRYRFTNASNQIQDIAVSLEGGIAPARVFSQQVPQLLGSFGALGAATGAIASFGGIFAAQFINKLFEGVEATKSFDDALKELSDTIKITKDGTVLLSEEFEMLAAKSQDVAEVQLRARLISATAASNAAFTELKNTVEDFNSELGVGSRSIISQRSALKDLGEEYGLTSKEVKELARLTRQAVGSESLDDVQTLRDRVTELGTGSAATNENFIKLAQSTNEWASSMEESQRISELLNQAIENQGATIAASSETAVAEVERLREVNERVGKELEAYFAREEELSTTHNQRMQRLRERDSQRRLRLEIATNRAVFSAQTDFAGQVASLLQQGQDENSAAAKAGYAIAQGIQVAQAINNANLAYTGIIASSSAIPDPTGATLAAGIARAELVRNLGFATAALIAGNAVGNLAGRAQGGQVRPGEAYRVGEYGPETLVMGSTGGRVVPGAMNDGAKLEVINNVEVIGAPADTQVRTEVTETTDRKVVQNIVIEMLQTTGRGFQTLQRNSNIQPRGQR